jgi:DNA-binding beta-propeller fold protein YncE
MHTRIFLLLAALIVGLSGCAGLREKQVFALDVDATLAKRLMFPPEEDGEVPRYIYVGHLYGDRNIRDPEAPEKGPLDVLARLLEFIKGEAPPNEIYRPQAGAIDGEGRILVADRGTATVLVFDEKAATLELWQQADGSRKFVSPVGVAIGADGIVYVADSELGLVARLDRQGNSIGPIGKGHLTRPTGIAYDAKTRRIYVADTGDHQIKLFDTEGGLLDAWGERGEGPGEFNFPTYVSISGEKLYVADTMNARVQVLSTQTGKHLATVGKLGMYVGNMVRPKGVAVDSEGNIYVVESYYDHLLVYNSKGEYLMAIGGVGTEPGKFHLPSGVWVDSHNRVFVADTLNSRVSVFQFLGGGTESE